MLQPRPHPRRPRRLARAIGAFACGALLVMAVPSAGGRTIEFEAPTTGGIELGQDDHAPGVTGTVKFNTSRADKRTLGAAQDRERLLARAEQRTDAAVRADQRIAAIQELLDEVQEDEARLRAVIYERLAARYKSGDTSDVQFLLSGDGLSDLLTRGEVLADQSKRDQRTLAEYEVTLEKVELYQQVLEELRDINGTQARDLRDRADRLEQVLVASKVGHDEAPPGEGKQPKGVDGTWYVMDGAFTAQLFLPGGGSGYDGGETRFPKRRATAVQIQAVLGDSRIDLDSSGYQDVLTGQIDGRLLDAMMAAARQFGYIKITSLKSDHGVYTSSGNVSEHAFGCAMDIGTIGSTYITPGSQVHGGEVHQAVMFFAGLGVSSGTPDLGPHQVISLFDLGGATLAMGDHGDHIHVGYSC